MKQAAQVKTTELDGTVEILTREQVAEWLKIKPRQVDRFGIPCILLGRKTQRWMRSDVIDFLRERRKTA